MRIRASPEDFRVEEIPLYPPSGSGDHLFVLVEKTERTTEQVVRSLARRADVKARDIGYAGRKDRNAITRQWFSVPGWTPEAARSHEGDGFVILEAVPHGHKLRTGQLRGNRFELVVRELDADQLAAAPGRIERLVRTGMPNFFGEQRFGRDGDNERQGLAFLKDGLRHRDKRAARFALSALQSAVFNDWLGRRSLGLDEIEAGEVAWIHTSGACFVVEDVVREAPRAARFEISAAGPMPGPRLLAAAGGPLERERAIFAAHGLPDPITLPRGVRMRGARRPARVRPEEMRCEALGADAVRLHFTLPAGSYATVLVDAVFTDGALGA